jgi:hypothetical protein
MTEAIRQSLIDLLREMKIDDEIGDETRLYHDLSIAGEDAGELLDAIHKRFGTRFWGFDFEVYFPDESEAGPGNLRLAVWDRPRRRFTFGHLVSVVERGRWFDPPDATAGERSSPAPLVKWVSRAALIGMALLVLFPVLYSVLVAALGVVP